jgi:porphobilinogen synthase
MPGIFRRSIDLVEVKKYLHLGIRAVTRKVDENLKTIPEEAWNPNGLMQMPLSHQSRLSEMMSYPMWLWILFYLWCDGIIGNGDVENDSTNDALVKWRLLAQAGADFVAPSDMMDGRVLRAKVWMLQDFITWAS